MSALRQVVATAICKSGRFETGEGTCAAICMQCLGNPRRSGCSSALQVHGKLTDAILTAIDASPKEPN